MSRSASRPTPPSPFLDGLNFALHQHYVFWPISLPLFHAVTRPYIVVAVSMSCSYVEQKESHVDLGIRVLHDPERSQASLEADDHSMRDAMFSQ
jgi:hypothetical protein